MQSTFFRERAALNRKRTLEKDRAEEQRVAVCKRFQRYELAASGSLGNALDSCSFVTDGVDEMLCREVCPPMLDLVPAVLPALSGKSRQQVQQEWKQRHEVFDADSVPRMKLKPQAIPSCRRAGVCLCRTAAGVEVLALETSVVQALRLWCPGHSASRRLLVASMCVFRFTQGPCAQFPRCI